MILIHWMRGGGGGGGGGIIINFVHYEILVSYLHFDDHHNLLTRAHPLAGCYANPFQCVTHCDIISCCCCLSVMSCMDKNIHISLVWKFKIILNINFSDAGDRIVQLCGSIPCLVMLWLLKSPGHQQAWYWLCRIDIMSCCSRVNFIYLGQAKLKIRFKMWIYLCNLENNSAC